MRAISIESFGGAEKLRTADLPRPKPVRGEVLIRTVSAGVNPMDWKICEGIYEGVLPHAFPLVPGWDVAGVVEELGEATAHLRKGDKVWACARKPTVQWGTYAEFVAVPEDSVALMPAKLLFEEAASVPMAALTAYQALFDVAHLEEGADVLIHAAAGGVGHFAVQLAKSAGARVFGTAGPAGHSFVMGLGADGVIDYTREDLGKGLGRLCPDGPDVVLDTMGGDAQEQSLELLKPGGVLVSTVEQPDSETVARRGLRAGLVSVKPSGDQLRILASMVEHEKLGTNVSKIYSLAEAAAAHEESRAGHVHGKLVLAL